MTPDQIFWNSPVEEVIMPTNSGQMGVLAQHAPLITAVDIGVMSIRQNNAWSFLALMNGFALIRRNQITVLVNSAEAKDNIELEVAEKELNEAQQNVDNANERKQRVEASLALKRARTRYLVAHN